MYLYYSNICFNILQNFVPCSTAHARTDRIWMCNLNSNLHTK